MQIIDHLTADGDGHQHLRRGPDAIIVHCMAEAFIVDGTRLEAWEWCEKLGLSAHMYALADGTGIRQRHDQQFAYHALGFNDDSLGVEILVPGLEIRVKGASLIAVDEDYRRFYDVIERPYMTPDQEAFVRWQVSEWRRLHGIQPRRIEGHRDVDPARKKDPGDGVDLGTLRGA